MNKEEFEKKTRAFFKEWMDREDEIMRKAKEEGVWVSGLDTNKELFVELNIEMKARMKELKKEYELLEKADNER